MVGIVPVRTKLRIYIGMACGKDFEFLHDLTKFGNKAAKKVSIK